MAVGLWSSCKIKASALISVVSEVYSYIKLYVQKIKFKKRPSTSLNHLSIGLRNLGSSIQALFEQIELVTSKKRFMPAGFVGAVELLELTHSKKNEYVSTRKVSKSSNMTYSLRAFIVFEVEPLRKKRIR